jgi:hypothetical protein
MIAPFAQNKVNPGEGAQRKNSAETVKSNIGDMGLRPQIWRHIMQITATAIIQLSKLKNSLPQKNTKYIVNMEIILPLHEK